MQVTAPTQPPAPASAWAFTWRNVPPLAAALALGFGALFAVRVLFRPIAILLLAITLRKAMAPIVGRLERRMPRTAAIALVYLGLVLIAGLVGWGIVPDLSQQMRDLAHRLPDMLQQLERLATRWDRVADGKLGQLATRQLGDVADWVVGLPLRLVSSLFELMLVLFLSIYWLSGAPALRRFVLSLLPLASRERVGGVLSEMGSAMGGYVRGAAINSLIMGGLAWLGLTVIGVNYALVLGLLTMLAEPVPYVGPIAAGVVVTLAALLQSPGKALLAVILFTALQQLEGHILTPNIMSKQTHTSQAVVIFALLAGAAVGGLLGALVAIPVAGVAQVFVVKVLAPAIRRRNGVAAPELV